MNSAFKRPPIDGNAVIRDIQHRRNSIAPGEGRISDGETGQILVSSFGNPAAEAVLREEPPAPDQSEAIAADELAGIYAQEMADGGDNSMLMQQRGATQDYVNGEMPMEAFTPAELKRAQTDYLNTAGQFSNFAEQNGMDMNELMGRFSEEYTPEDLAMFKDARKIKNFNDAMKVGMMGDEMADFMDLDTDKFFGEEGVMEKCGPICQEKRAQLRAQQQRPPQNPDGSMMAMPDQDFEKKYASMNL